MFAGGSRGVAAQHVHELRPGLVAHPFAISARDGNAERDCSLAQGGRGRAWRRPSSGRSMPSVRSSSARSFDRLRSAASESRAGFGGGQSTLDGVQLSRRVHALQRRADFDQFDLAELAGVTWRALDLETLPDSMSSSSWCRRVAARHSGRRSRPGAAALSLSTPRQWPSCARTNRRICSSATSPDLSTWTAISYSPMPPAGSAIHKPHGMVRPATQGGRAHNRESAHAPAHSGDVGADGRGAGPYRRGAAR
jgi:hypothetical protein